MLRSYIRRLAHGHMRRLAGDARGATAIEYGLIVALIVIGIISVISAVGGQTGSMWRNNANKVAAVENF